MNFVFYVKIVCEKIVKECIASIIHDHGIADESPYILVKIRDNKFNALLDSGTSVSVLGYE